MNPPQFTLKAVIFIHFILTVWATMSGFLSSTYNYMNLFVLMVGVLGIVFEEHADIVFMFFLLHVFTILEDILLLGLYQPRANSIFEKEGFDESRRNEYRFALGMAIVNLILKPFTAFLLFRVSQERGGNYAAISFPGVSNLPGFGGRGGMYEDIDHSSPQHTNIETAEPHKTLENPSIP
ncbi:hypothetical protein CHS0354_027234 [Potamilus streckersoni]|uniref:Uncharacterized protein n=1 Tax=Potamilus streckersoni TaxID=2493646 RepID=A0AAE0RQV1_9BIVA|nr:hypothetical protein CHS0354_027234 [Potamilus streckersoni]